MGGGTVVYGRGGPGDGVGLELYDTNYDIWWTKSLCNLQWCAAGGRSTCAVFTSSSPVMDA